MPSVPWVGAALAAVLLAGCASGPTATPPEEPGGTDLPSATTSPSWSSGPSSSSGGGTYGPKDALFVLMERATWVNRTSGEGYPATRFGGHCSEANWSEDHASVRVQRYGEPAAPWPASGILVKATEHAGFDEMAIAGTTAPVVAAFDAEGGSLAIPAAVVERGNLTHLVADGSGLSIDGAPLAEGEAKVFDYRYTIEHDDGRWEVHERLRFGNHGQASVTVVAPPGMCV